MTRLKWKIESVCLEIVLLLMQDRCTVSAECIIGSEVVLDASNGTQWYFKVTRLKWKLDSVYLEIVLILTQDKCTVYAERTIGSEIDLDAPDGTPR